MPHSSDDPSSDRISAEAPSAQPAEGLESEPTGPSQPNPSAEDLSIESDPQGRTADSGEAPRLPRRRRRRRRPPRAADPAAATADRQGQAEQPATAGDATQSGDLPATQPPEDAPRRRRRRRRGQRRDASSPGAAVGGAAPAAERAPGAQPSFARPDNDPTQIGASQSAPPSDGETREDQPHKQPRSRRRPRRPPHPAEANATEADQSVSDSAAEGTPAGAPQNRSAPYRGSRNRGARNRRSGDERPPERGPAGDKRPSLDRRA